MKLTAVLSIMLCAFALGACKTTGGNTATTAKPRTSAGFKRSIRIEEKLLSNSSRARACGGAVSAAMGAAAATIYYVVKVGDRVFKRDDKLMTGLAIRAYRGQYRGAQVICDAAFQATLDAYLVIKKHYPQHRTRLYRIAVTLLKSDGEYEKFLARVTARQRARQARHARRQAPAAGPNKWERVFELPKNALDL